MRRSLGIVGVAVLGAVPALHSDADAVRLEPAVQRYLSREAAQDVSGYCAFRRLEAEGMGHSGWLEAWTEVRGGAFTYQITGQGGSEKVRRRVLHKVLENERDAWASGEVRRSEVNAANYEFTASAEQPDGLLKILMKPRRKGKLMLDGALFLERAAADLVRVEGRAVSNPSFWIRRVDIVKHYQRVNGLNVPVHVESLADIRFAGKATFRMSYKYSELNGLPTIRTGTLASAGGR